MEINVEQARPIWDTLVSRMERTSSAFHGKPTRADVDVTVSPRYPVSGEQLNWDGARRGRKSRPSPDTVYLTLKPVLFTTEVCIDALFQ